MDNFVRVLGMRRMMQNGGMDLYETEMSSKYLHLYKCVFKNVRLTGSVMPILIHYVASMVMVGW